MRDTVNFDTLKFNPQSDNKVTLKVNYNVIPRVYFIDNGKHIEVNIPQRIFEAIRKRAQNLLIDMLDEVNIIKDERGFFTIK